MKALSFLICLLPFGSILSQTTKGDWLLNGNGQANYYEATRFNDDSGYIELSVQGGYFVLKGLCVGATVSGSFYSNLNRNYSIGFAPFVRGYLGSKKFRPFLQIDGGRKWDLAKSNFGSFNSHETLLNGRLGQSLFLSKNASIEVHLDYNILRKRKSGQFSGSNNDGFLFGAGMNFFLTKESYEPDSVALAKTFLKKGVTAIEINATGDFKPVLIGNYNWKKMLRDRLLLQIGLTSYHGFGEELEYVSIHFPSVEIRPYFPLSGSLFFAPAFGGGSQLVASGKPFDLDRSFNLLTRPVMQQFFQRSTLELGLEAIYRDGKDWPDELPNWSGNAFLSGTYYLTPGFGVRGEIWANLFGDPIFNNGIFAFTKVGEVHFRLGFQYFWQKRKRK